MENTTITARCLCKAQTFTTTVKTSSLPLQATCCHCDSCRHTTGAMYLGTVEWPNPDEDVSALHRYAFSPNVNDYSCPTCGSQLFCKGTGPDDKLEAITAVLHNGPDLVRYAKHIFVGDTLDGGATIWFPTDVSGNPLPRWSSGRDRSELLPSDWPSSPSPSPGINKTARVNPDSTPLRCHCGGVDLVLRSAADLVASDSDLPWYVEPGTRRYFASADGCDSCRLAFSCDLAHWTFGALDHIGFASTSASSGEEEKKFPGTVDELKEAVGAVKDRDPRFGTLTFYQSSPDVERYFCKRCAANVFYAVHVEGRTDMVDISVGVLKHPDGARAEGLLAWNYGVVGWMEDNEGGWRKGLLEGARAASDAWREGMGIPKSWRRVLREMKDA
ncbi:Mss4-like protein [Echria macrotheca]|uniref:Mss4-like protein n=1 Tax=Echria macrotheca TaxID=438768 RepID=A0AAJ0F5P0_9PEZI|nr:Mss4-like protein [Echria macrotheca]